MSSSPIRKPARRGEGPPEVRREERAALDGEDPTTPDSNPPLKRAAQYLRMSTDQQRYSLQAQAEAIQGYAALHRLDIVRSYVDAGKSGTTFDRRDGLKALISDVVNGQADFEAVIVLDVSRWGRFPDPDQAAHYEFMCREAGIDVQYCAEAFANEDTMAATVVKHLKRVMAGEYSRELSAKVATGKRFQAKRGFRQGSAPPYGFRRLVIDEAGNPKRVVGHGERKGMPTDRVILAHGSEAELRAVRSAFRKFADEHGWAVAVLVISPRVGRPCRAWDVGPPLRSDTFCTTRSTAASTSTERPCRASADRRVAGPLTNG